MKTIFLFLITLTFLVLSCGDDPVSTETDCSPDCKSWEECIEGECKVKENNCASDTDCTDAGSVCNISTHLCELSKCSEVCEGWQSCNADTGACEIKSGRCDETSLCNNPSKPVCSEQHYCVEESNDCEKVCESDSDCNSDDICDPFKKVCQKTTACDSMWQYCYEGSCATRQGFCDADSACTNPDLPICDLENHLCMPQETGCSPQCEPYQVCNMNKECVTAPGFCETNTDCLISPSRPICDTNDHTCKSEAINFLQPATLDVKSLIITNEQLKSKFEELARIHNLTGTPVDVITVEDICGTRTCNNSPQTDKASAIKAYLKTRENDIKYVLLGGDIEIIPSRRVHDTYNLSFAGYEVNEDRNFYTDYYYSDLNDWDSNNNGIYAEDSDNLGDYRPELAVSRVSVSNIAELETYIAKVKDYMFNYEVDSVQRAVFMSNVATSIAVPVGDNINVDIDGAQYFEMDTRTVDIINGNSVGANVSFIKLYNNSSSSWGAKKLSCDDWDGSCNIRWAIEGGGPGNGNGSELYGGGNPNLIVHMGHGGVNTLMVEQRGGENAFTGDMAYSLTNYVPSILLSCACEAATFSADDSAGEKLVNAPNGGAIIYLGDSSIGLGLAGGAQFIDEFIRHFYQNRNIIIGDAIFAAHQNMPTTDRLQLPLLSDIIGNFLDSPISRESYEWTQKVTTFLGDLLIPAWNSPREYLSNFTITQGSLQQFPNASDLDIRSSATFPANTFITILTSTGNYYEIDLSSKQSVLKEIDEKPSYIYYGIRSEATFYAFGKKDF